MRARNEGIVSDCRAAEEEKTQQRRSFPPHHAKTARPGDPDVALPTNSGVLAHLPNLIPNLRLFDARSPCSYSPLFARLCFLCSRISCSISAYFLFWSSLRTALIFLSLSCMIDRISRPFLRRRPPESAKAFIFS